MARCAKKLGIELFVLDDGWFKNRNNDNAGLGDWIENFKKLPHGLKGLSSKINKLGLEFGIWVEPEMVNENSDLYRSHPEWVIKVPNHNHSTGRNQMILDLSNSDVIDYLYKSLDYVFSESNCTYCKWDMNRIFSDYFSTNIDSSKMMELSHRYILGLYSLFMKLKRKYPNVLIEGCASGGNRFDLGMLSYTPQIWASDNQDPTYRMKAQYNYSFGYPLNTLGSHVGMSPTSSILRRHNLIDRFNVSLYGAFGYEIDLREESNKNKKLIKSQIEFYKKCRDKIAYSDYHRLYNDGNNIVFEAVSKDKSLSLITDYQIENLPINAYHKIKTKGLDDNFNYNILSEKRLVGVKSLGSLVNMISPIKVKDGGFIQNILDKVYKFYDSKYEESSNGSILNNNGFIINESFSGAGFNNKLRIMKDFESRLYVINKKSD